MGGPKFYLASRNYSLQLQGFGLGRFVPLLSNGFHPTAPAQSWGQMAGRMGGLESFRITELVAGTCLCGLRASFRPIWGDRGPSRVSSRGWEDPTGDLKFLR
jgi:hypothetical protein